MEKKNTNFSSRGQQHYNFKRRKKITSLSGQMSYKFQTEKNEFENEKEVRRETNKKREVFGSRFTYGMKD